MRSLGQTVRNQRRGDDIMWRAILGTAALVLSTVVSAPADARVYGSCDRFQFSKLVVDPSTKREVKRSLVKEDGALGVVFLTRIINAGAPVYRDPSLSGSPVQSLGFDEKVQIVATTPARDALKVSTVADKELGWVAPTNVLCLLTPATSNVTHLEQKFFVRTETTKRDELKSVRAYPTPRTDDCGDRQCKELSRFETYYVFGYDDQSRRYLLGGSYKVGLDAVLVGWVPEDDGILWETNYGLRPRENLKIAAGEKDAGEEKAVCVYPSVQDALLKQKCQPLLGGMRWFKYPMRAPVLGRSSQDDRFYRVVLPVAGKAGSAGDDAFEVALQLDKSVDGIKDLGTIDVFFLIDGTNSMQPYIDQVVGTKARPGFVQNILALYAKDDRYQGAALRFGYRVYRDKYAGEDELGEGQPFSKNCSAGADELRRDQDEFQTALSSLKASTGDAAKGDNDLEENLFGGLLKALDDIYVCPDHQKVVFVIGDHGYSAANQAARGRGPISMQDLIPFFAGDPSDEQFTPLVTFFVQTPSAVTSDAAGAAHRAFYNQGKELVEAIVLNARQRSALNLKNATEKAAKLTKSPPEDFLLSIQDEGQILQAALDKVKLFSNVKVLNEVIADLRGGSALVDIIERLQGSERYGNLPGLAWDIITAKACKALGSGCYEQVFDTILEGVVADNGEVTEDVWLTEDQFGDWRTILGAVPDIVDLPEEAMLRKALVSNLTTSLSKVLNGLSVEATGEEIGKFLQRTKGLPIGNDTRLLSYSLQELSDESRIEQCEVTRLISWLNSSKEILEIVNRNYYPDVKIVPADAKDCPLSRELPRLAERPSDERFPETSMRFNPPISGTRIWWVPRQFLP